jgi:phage replication O-like protein O
MANPQKENGYTPIANEILEQLAKFKLNGIQLRILLTVLRFTYGFNRKSHNFSLTFLEESVEADKRGLLRELKLLVNMNILVEIKDGNRTRKLIFNKDYESWKQPVVENSPVDNSPLENSPLENYPKSSGEQSTTSKIPVVENSPPKKERSINTINKEKIFLFKPEHLELAQNLLDKILKNNPNYRKPKTLDSWANTFRLMVENDCRSPDAIKDVIDWCQKDSFWKTNILSVDSLRKQFDRLWLQMKEGNNGSRYSSNNNQANRKSEIESIDYGKLEYRES